MPVSVQLDYLANELESLRDKVLAVDKIHSVLCDKIHPNYQYNSLNFLRYLKLRTFDLRHIQGQLSSLGFSSLSHIERQVLANIENILYLLKSKLNEPFAASFPFGEHPVNFIESANRLRNNSNHLFGSHDKEVAVMVTLSKSALKPEHISDLINAGMKIARINCAHDEPEEWLQMVTNVREVGAALNCPCKIYMDLAGPKLRTRKVWAPQAARYDGKFPIVRVGSIVHMIENFGTHRAKELIEMNSILFTSKIPALVKDLHIGNHIWIDDGKIGGVVTKKNDGEIEIEITNANPKGSKLRTKKGINVPDSQLNLRTLSKVDLKNLDFIAQHADMVGFSFVRKPKDIELLQAELLQRNRSDIGIILKIENREAFNNLPRLILKAMESPSFGVMTARGDLAVELGPERLSEVQEEIMWLCEAAMIPNIWATQVLEHLTKKGTANRPEITDAAMSARVECVMLNKGPHIIESLAVLHNILDRMEHHVYKKLGIMGKLHVAEKFWEAKPKPSKILETSH